MYWIYRRWEVLNSRIRFDWQYPKGFGRFGGGWDWRVGFAIGGDTLMLELLTCCLVISFGQWTKGHTMKCLAWSLIVAHLIVAMWFACLILGGAR